MAKLFGTLLILCLLLYGSYDRYQLQQKILYYEYDVLNRELIRDLEQRRLLRAQWRELQAAEPKYLPADFRDWGKDS